MSARQTQASRCPPGADGCLSAGSGKMKTGGQAARADRTTGMLLWLNLLLLLLAAVWLRGRSLANMPGINGDEAWYGVQAWSLLHGGLDGPWRTPTGNPLNMLFLGPITLLQRCFPPSIVLLRSVAVASGLAALAINWVCCRWVFDRRTALVSTLALAVLPINIAYSRFAWDASQSLAATLCVIYLALAAVQFPHRFGRWMAASVFALVIAVWVHPTNVFASVAIAVACAAHCRRTKKNAGVACCGGESSQRMKTGTGKAAVLLAGLTGLVILFAAGLLMAARAGGVSLAQGRLPELLIRWWGNVQEWPSAIIGLPRLFSGGTIYRYIGGSRSWFEWPLPADSDGWGLDVGLFWAAVFGSAWMLWRSWRRRHEEGRSRLGGTDGVLLVAWILEIAAFLAAAGPRAMMPGQERFAICLIGPTVLLVTRGSVLAWEVAGSRARWVPALAVLAGWLVLADFHTHYFRFIERTGGQAHLTFRTGAVEPKQAALLYILDMSSAIENRVTAGQGSKRPPLWIVCSEWWNYWPIRYLASAQDGAGVLRPKEIGSPDDYRRALDEGRVWFVEFCDTDALRQIESQLEGRRLLRQTFFDYAGRPLLCVLHALPK